MKSEINAQNISQSSKDEHQDIEQELYIVPLDKDAYQDSDNIDDIDDIVDGTIKQTGESSFEISLSKQEVLDKTEEEKIKEEKTEKSFLDKVHGFLDIAGFVPALGAIPDIANGIIYLCQGDFVNMSMSFVAAIPGYGDTIAGVAKGAKYVAKASKYVKTSKLARIESNHVTEQAMFIIRMAKGQQTKNVSLLWTNGTKMNAHKVVEKVQSMAPDLNIRMLETTSRGVKMEKIVNNQLVKFAREETKMTQHEIKKALRDGTLWSKLETNPKFNKVLKPRLEKFEANVSMNYAKKSSDDVIVEFYDKTFKTKWNQKHSLYGKTMERRTFIPGPANKPEINVLRKLRHPHGKRSIDGIIGVDPIN